VAYTLNGVSDMRTRPVTFLYNGGPGSASLWLHMASVGPARVLTASQEATGAAPYRIVPNEYSLLDKTNTTWRTCNWNRSYEATSSSAIMSRVT